jgi:hypothetical protein
MNGGIILTRENTSTRGKKTLSQFQFVYHKCIPYNEFLTYLHPRSWTKTTFLKSILIIFMHHLVRFKLQRRLYKHTLSDFNSVRRHNGLSPLQNSTKSLLKQITFSEVRHPLVLSCNYCVHKQSIQLSIYHLTQSASTFKSLYQAKKIWYET